MGFKDNGILHQDVSRGALMTKKVVQRGFNGNVLGGCPTSRCVQRGGSMVMS